MAATIPIKYRAFLSYAHADAHWGRWLHRRLETYTLDRELHGLVTANGPVPKSLRPIFRDREDFSGGQILTDATISALDASAALIVLCSTVAATRPAVNEEVRLFKVRHPERPLIPVIVDGLAPENFPPALRLALNTDGTLTDRPVTILAPDLRDRADGKELGLAKIVAGLTGLEPDVIYRRAERTRRRTLRNWVAGLSGITMALAGLAVWAEFNRREAVAQRLTAELNFAAAKGAADGLIIDITGGLENVEGLRADTVRAILTTAEKTISQLVRTAPGNPELQRSQADMLSRFADVYEKLGDPQALVSARRSLELTQKLAADAPSDTSLQEAVAFRFFDLGRKKARVARSDEALAHHARSLELAQKLLKDGSRSAVAVRLVPANLESLSDLKFRVGDVEEAINFLTQSIIIMEGLVKKYPELDTLEHDLTIALQRMAKINSSRGDTSGALLLFERSLQISRRWNGSNPDNTSWQEQLALSLVGGAELKSAPEDVAAKLEAYQEAELLYERLTTIDPRNAVWQRQLAVTINRNADFRLQVGETAAALEAYSKSIAIFGRLAALQPLNTGSQRDLAMNRGQLADLKIQLGQDADALKLYKDTEAGLRKLAVNEPSNVEWSNGLSTVLSRIGRVLERSDDLPAALRAFEQSLETNRAISTRDPGNLGLQRDLALSLQAVARVKLRDGDRTGALPFIQESLQVLRRRAETGTPTPLSHLEMVPSLQLLYNATSDRAVGHAALREAAEILKTHAAHLTREMQGWPELISRQLIEH